MKDLKIIIFTMIVLGFQLLPIYADEAGLDISSAGVSFWYELIDTEEVEALSRLNRAFGRTAVEISPDTLGSQADRIVWYTSGPALWFENGHLVQLRLTSGISGSVNGISMGSSRKDVRTAFGEPWVERANCLYYNLPWRGGPVRLRLIFSDNGLDEVYIYIVR